LQRATLTVECITPCFLAGADQGGTAEWRAASVRGQLRWWFRAVAGGLFSGNLQRVRELESSVFGSTERAAALLVRTLGAPRAEQARGMGSYGRPLTGRGLAALWGDSSQATIDRLTLSTRDHPDIATNPLHYLAYGPVTGRDCNRSFLPPETTAQLLLGWDPSRCAEPALGEQLLGLALWAWLYLGGLGSRSRKGYGSLGCRKIEGELPGGFPPLTGPAEAAFQAGLKAIRDSVASQPTGPLPAWSHFSPHSRIYRSAEPFATWEEALMAAGAWLIAFRRRYGSPGDTRPLGAGRLQDRDYTWIASATLTARERQLPDRAGFGLPLPFHLRNRGGGTKTVAWGNDIGARRASPLLIHVSRFGREGYRVVWTHLPALLVPPGETLQVHQAGLSDASPSPAPPRSEQLSVIERFLADLEGKTLIREVKP